MPTNPFNNLRPTPAMIHAAGATVLAAAGALFYLAFYAPAAADIAERTERMDEVRRLMGQSEQVAREYRQLQSRLAELREAADETSKRMPRRPSTEEFIESLTQLAAVNGLQVKLCSAAAPQALPSHTQVEVACDLEGSFAGICQFLANVEQLSQISKLSSLRVDTTGNSDNYPVTVKFRLYYRAQLHDTEVKRGTT